MAAEAFNTLGYCWYHDDICETVEREMRIHGPPQTAEELEEIRKKKAIEFQKRNKKVQGYWKKVNKEEKRKYKSSSNRLTEEEQIRRDKDIEEFLKACDERRKEHQEMLRNYISIRQGQKKCTLEKDKIYDISLLLSGGRRRTDAHYLIYNNGVQVNVDQLHGKYVLLYFLSLPDDPGHTPHKPDPNFGGDLKEIYDIYNPRGEFEVVFVALGNNKDVFRDSFSLMPWLAIPHEDQLARDFFITELAVPYSKSEKPFLFAPDGTLLHYDARALFVNYGSQLFPFTNQRIRDISAECFALRDGIFLKKQKPSLTALLGNYLISSYGEKVPTSKLEGKIVGLYFCEPTFGGFQRTSRLLEIWNSLKDKQREAFEIVFINKAPFNLSDAKESFKNKFGYTIPWYSLAICGRKLCWVFENGFFKVSELAGDFIVLQSDRYQPLSYFAFSILDNFGVDAYPFTLQSAVEFAKSKQHNQLVLGELLSPEAPLRRGGSACHKEDTTVSKLLGRRVLLLFATHSCYESGLFLPALKRMYEKKGTNDDYEIIYISLDCVESPSSFPKSIQGMPWLVHSFAPDFAVSLAQQVFYAFPLHLHLPAIAAFGPDGHLETKESNLALKRDWNLNFPFIQADMDEEVYMELINLYKWDLERLDKSDKYDMYYNDKC